MSLSYYLIVEITLTQSHSKECLATAKWQDLQSSYVCHWKENYLMYIVAPHSPNHWLLHLAPQTQQACMKQ